jgi:hypothetical protein
VNNMYKPRIGIVGAGTVGQALIAAFEGRAQLFVNDPRWGVASSPIAEMGASCEAIFVAVPTPSSAAGDADVAVLESVLVELGSFVSNRPFRQTEWQRLGGGGPICAW